MIEMRKEAMLVTGAGQIGMALARRTGFGKKMILGDKSLKNAENIAKIMNDAGFDRKLSAAIPESTVLKGLTIRGNDCQNKQDSVRKSVNNWIAGFDI